MGIAEIHNVREFANAIRCLAVDMVNIAGSGHQGAALGFADVMAVLFNGGMNFAPGDEARDRFVLSVGHASAALYAAVYLSGKTRLTKEDLMSFRRLGSLCQGHPDVNKEIGVEMTTGALGQGLATAVGMAVALKKKRLQNKVFVVVGDGCLMEGVSHEALTLAASLQLDNIIVMFDDNDVCIDGKASDVTTDNSDRLAAYGFNTLSADGHDFRQIADVIDASKKSGQPTFIAFRTSIGKSSNVEGTAKCHVVCVPQEEAMNLRRVTMMPLEEFAVPEHLTPDPIPASCTPSLHCLTAPNIPENEILVDLRAMKYEFAKDTTMRSTRYFSGIVFERLTAKYDVFIGGAADLSESCCTISNSSVKLGDSDWTGNYVHYGIREHAMGCAMNGLALEGFIPFGGTFLVFSDYMKPAIRNAALMRVAPIFVFTHDSVAVGEDGATHQPIEQLAALRAIPHFNVFRPCCGVEVVECIELAISDRTTPSAIVLTRQNLEAVPRLEVETNLSATGMYELVPFMNDGRRKVTIVATGSEIQLAAKVRRATEGFDIRIISAPCFELFDMQSSDYRSEILAGRKLIMEAGSTICLHKYRTREDDTILGIDKFGESGNPEELFAKLGLSVHQARVLLGDAE
jgi:transketolase